MHMNMFHALSSDSVKCVKWKTIVIITNEKCDILCINVDYLIYDWFNSDFFSNFAQHLISKFIFTLKSTIKINKNPDFSKVLTDLQIILIFKHERFPFLSIKSIVCICASCLILTVSLNEKNIHFRKNIDLKLRSHLK